MTSRVTPYFANTELDEGWFREDSEVIDFFAPPREDFLLGGKPVYISED